MSEVGVRNMPASQEKLDVLKWLAETCKEPGNKALYAWQYERERAMRLGVVMNVPSVFSAAHSLVIQLDEERPMYARTERRVTDLQDALRVAEGKPVQAREWRGEKEAEGTE